MGRIPGATQPGGLAAVLPGMQTVRFTRVVEEAGRPAPYLSWTPPDKDAELRRLVKQERVMTLHQELRGPRKDFGTVGLHRESAAQVLVFPKSLRRFAGRKVVGIDYRLVGSESHNAGPKVKPRPGPAPSTFVPPRAQHPVLPKDDVPRGPISKEESGESLPSPKTADHSPARSPEELRREIRKALAELKAGKSVAAYERLRALV